MEGVRIPQVGEVVAGKYRLKRLLGEGGMGSVLEAEHLKLRQPIAIKFLNPSLLGVDEIVQRFEREARAAATLRSRHVVRVTDVEATPEGVPYMVMELLHGADLESERERRKQLPYSEAVDYVLQACSALAEAHDAGIVHRDLKPGNLFLAREDSDRVIVKVLDFGISKFLHGDDVKLTSAGAIMGTALYMSPEQIRGDASIDARSDIWALGVILYELISGNAPWNGPTTRVAAAIVAQSVPDLRATVPTVPEVLANAIYRMLEKSPAHRHATIAEVAAAIAPFAPQGSVGAEVADHLARRSQRNIARDALASAPSMQAPTHTTPMGHVGSGSGSGSGAGAAVAVSVAATPSSSDKLLSRNPERSTMAATTTNANMMITRPRALWGVLAGFCTLAVAGVVLIVFVARSKPTDGTKGAPPPPTASQLASPEPSATPTPTAEPTTEPTSTVAVATPTPTVETAAAVRTPPVPVPGVAPSARKLAPAVVPTTSHAPTTTPRPAPKPSEAPAPPINPPFLK